MTTGREPYVHGYSQRERERLHDQAATLTELLHGDTRYLEGERVLEAGCGVGAQTVILAKNSPSARFVSVDVSRASLQRAAAMARSEGLANVFFEQGDIYGLPFREESFDHVFVCFVLEHLMRPREALLSLRRLLKPGGTITVIEGDHGSAYYHPESPKAQMTIDCLVRVQALSGGNSLIGRQLHPLLVSSGFPDAFVSPRVVYVDSSRPGLVEGFTRNTFIAMVEGVKEQAIERSMADESAWSEGIRDLRRTAEEDGTFCYTFFKGVATKA